MKKEEIIQTLRRHMPEIKRKFPLSALALFGSYARDEQTAESDIDVLVAFNGDIWKGTLFMSERIPALLAQPR